MHCMSVCRGCPDDHVELLLKLQNSFRTAQKVTNIISASDVFSFGQWRIIYCASCVLAWCYLPSASEITYIVSGGALNSIHLL